jgi:hypothetical protein
MRIRNWFDRNGALLHGYVTEFIGSKFLERNARVVSHLATQYQNTYRDYAINESRTLTEVIVHSDGVRTFVSGNHDDLFIIGRLDNGTLGISSAYFTRASEEKMRGARANLLWTVKGD